MAFWGAPEVVKDHAKKAVEAALNATAWWAGLPDGHPAGEFRTRFGIHTGLVLVGNIGGEERLNYRCIGGSVNLASRIEGLNKVYGTSIMVTGQTATQLGDAYLTRRLDTVIVKGATEPAVIHEMLGRTGEVSNQVEEWVGIYEEGHALYLDREFDRAANLLETVGAHDPPSAVLATRCRDFIAAPPGQGWDGVRRLDTK